MKYLACLCLLVIGCKGKDQAPTPTIASGSAAPVAADAAPPPTIDAGVELVIARDGTGPLRRLDLARHAEDETAAIIQQTLAPALPGITVRYGLHEAPGNLAGEVGYWTVTRGDQDVMKVLKQIVADPAKPTLPVTIVYTPELRTLSGTKVGDTAAILIPKYPDLLCYNDPTEPIAGAVSAHVTCYDKSEVGILYVLDDSARKLEVGKLVPSEVADIAIVAIVAIPN